MRLQTKITEPQRITSGYELRFKASITQKLSFSAGEGGSLPSLVNVTRGLPLALLSWSRVHSSWAAFVPRAHALLQLIPAPRGQVSTPSSKAYPISAPLRDAGTSAPLLPNTPLQQHCGSVLTCANGRCSRAPGEACLLQLALLPVLSSAAAVTAGR